MEDDENWDQMLFYDDDEEVYEESLFLTYEYCVIPNLIEIIPYIWKLFICNLIFRILVKTFNIPRKICHIMSIVVGTTVLYLLLYTSLPYISFFLIFALLSYCSIQNFFPRKAAYILSFIFISYLISSEFFFPVPSVWVETRGLHMVITMKLISVLFDIKHGIVKHRPGLLELTGYILCPGHCILGPWVSYHTYLHHFNQRMPLWDISWIRPFFQSILISISFLTLSNCWATWLLPHTFKWIVAYQEALSFRSSHYFISFLSEAMLYTAGYGPLLAEGDKKYKSSVSVTNPLQIEFPRSLVQVVVSWNMPMHVWLKNYVFRVSRPLGSFVAIIMTYLVSSFLHGCNLKLAAVLLSLGFYTYIEYKFRNRMSYIFNACIRANPCKKCIHKYRDHFYVKLANVLFGFLAAFHLAYLGCLMDTVMNNFDDGFIFDKWKDLGYGSHVVTGITYFVYKLI